MKKDCNSAFLTGTIASPFYSSYEINGEKCYMVYVDAERLSGTVDRIPVVIPEKLIKEIHDETGRFVEIYGEFCSRNRWDGEKRHLDLFLYARCYSYLEKLPEESKTLNKVKLIGCICQNPVYRLTPGGREIADILLAVNRKNGEPDFIPCIAWGHYAKVVSLLSVGDIVLLNGRMQSREYTKKVTDDYSETRIAYEISADKIKLIKVKSRVAPDADKTDRATGADMGCDDIAG